MRGQRVAEQIDAQLLRLHADEHAEQAGLVGDFQPLDLKVMLRVAEAREADLVAESDVFANLAEHVLIELGVLPRHARFDLGAVADGAIDKAVEFH